MADDQAPGNVEPNMQLDNKIKVALALAIHYVKNERQGRGAGAGFLRVLNDDFRDDPDLLRLVKDYAQKLKHHIRHKTMDAHELLAVYGGEAGEALLMDVVKLINHIGKPPVAKQSPVKGRRGGLTSSPQPAP